jgi:hypothetical protein
MRRWILGVAVLLTFSACKSVKTGAKEHFAKKFSCPDDRVSNIERKDIMWGSFILEQQKQEPPEEVKKDPGRLAKWQKDKADENKELKSHLDSLDVYEGNGCDHKVIMACYHTGDSEGGCDPSSVSCSDQEVEKKKVTP